MLCEILEPALAGGSDRVLMIYFNHFMTDKNSSMLYNNVVKKVFLIRFRESTSEINDS